MYKIVRSFLGPLVNGRHQSSRRTITTGLTLEAVQKHCSDPNSSSRTATSATAKRRTRDRGPWFDGYEECTK
jgi:hypothetical protein